MSDREKIDNLLQRLASAVGKEDFHLVSEIAEGESEEDVLKAAGRLAQSTGPEKMNAGRDFIFGFLAAKSNQRLMKALADLGKKVTFLAEGLDAVNDGLEKVNASVRKLDASSAKLGWKALAVAVVVGLFAVVQGTAAAIQIWKWTHGQ